MEWYIKKGGERYAGYGLKEKERSSSSSRWVTAKIGINGIPEFIPE
jgi:hypothetical protein